MTNSATPLNKQRSSIRLSWKKKIVFSLVVTTLMLLSGELLLALLGVRPKHVTEDPFVGFRAGSPMFVREAEFFRTNPAKLRYFNDQKFPARKTARTYRIFCLGGSTTYGHPYDDETSFVGWLRERLHDAEPDRDWQVVNCGGISYASYRNCRLMQELAAFQPDLFIMFDGHNEFLEERTYGELKRPGVVVLLTDLLVTRTRIGTVLSRLAGLGSSSAKQTVLLSEVDTILKSAVGPEDYHRDPGWHEAVLQHFRLSLDRAALISRAAGAQLILIKPTSNIRSFSPFKSEPGRISPTDSLPWRQRVEQGRKLRGEGNYAAAAQEFLVATHLDPQHAMTQWEAGDALFMAGDRPAAGRCFERAIDEDICPLRATSDIVAAIEESARQNRVPLVDFAKLLLDDLEAKAGHRLPGDESFLDHVHPTIENNRLIAWGLFDELVKLRVVRDRPADDGVEQRVSQKVLGGVDPQKQALALINVVQVLASAGKDVESLKLTERTEEVCPGLALVASYRGRMLEKLGRADDAFVWYQTAVERDPDALMPLSRLGAAHLARHEWGAALDYLERALRLAPDSAPETFRAELHLGFGKAYSGLERWKDAVPQFRRALALTPQSSEAIAGLNQAVRKSAGEGKLPPDR